MATLPSKNAFNDLSGGYYSYWTDGTTEGRATVAVLLGSTDAQAAAASLSSLALGTDLAVIHGGTGASTADDARTNLGLAIGTNVQEYSANLDALAADPLTATTAASTYLTQASAASTYLTQATAASTYLTIASAASTYQPLDADLTAIAALSSADGNFIVGSATGWVAESGATARTSLGLGNVENTALSTWDGSASITTLGTLTSGAINWTGAITTTGALASGSAGIVGTLRVSASAGSNVGAVLADQAGTGGAARVYGYNGAGTLRMMLNTNGDSYLLGGNFGIGTDTPSSLLHVAGNATVTGSLATSKSFVATSGVQDLATFTATSTGAPDGTFGARILLYTQNPNLNIWPAGIAAVNDVGGSNLSSLAIYTATAGPTLNEVARFTSGGNLTLTAGGSITTTGTLASGNATVTGTLGVTSTISVTGGVILFTTANTYIQDSGGTLFLGTGGSSSLNIDASKNATFSGSVGIGISPSVPLQVGAGAAGTNVAVLRNAGGYGFQFSAQTGGGGVNSRITVGAAETLSLAVNNGVDFLTTDTSGNATFAGKVNTAASTTARASLNIPSGTAPTSPTNGDIWSDGSDILVRLGGTTYTLTKA